ncbi:MAG: carboxypeptidase regulatory-like domain-containing protein [Deltaproteobacteria bacterium]|nr:carboxypeptidase regulatory-like domain-containing protein [Deltaproteobacteria bacterium]
MDTDKGKTAGGEAPAPDAPDGQGPPRPRNVGTLIGLVAGAALMIGFLLATFIFVLLPRVDGKKPAREAGAPAADRADGAGDAPKKPGPAEFSGLVSVPPGTDPRTVHVRWLEADGEVLGEVVPDQDGRFRFETPEAWAGSILVSCTGMPSVVRRAVPPAVGFDVAIAPGTALDVHVVDDTGAPVAGALVAPDIQEPLWSEGERRAVARADAVTTDAGGAARLLVPGTGTVEVVVEADGHVSGRSDPIELPATEPLELELPRGGRLAGEVVDAAGAPVTGSTVRVVGSGLWPAKEFPTDSGGRFDAGLIPPGFYEAEAFDGTRVSPLRRGVEVRPAETTTIRLAVASGGFVAGRVAAEGAGADGVAGFAVTVHGLQSRLVPLRAAVGAGGRFRVGPLQPGRYLVRCAQSPFLPAEAWVEVVAGGEGAVVLELRNGRRLDGRIVGPDGAPVAEARVSLSGRADDGTFVFRSPTTEALASLDRRGLAPVGRLLPIGELGVLEGPLPPIPPRPFAWLDDQAAADAPGDAAGEVVSSQSSVLRPDPPSTAAAPDLTTENRKPKTAPLTTDTHGAVSLAGLPPGKYTIRVAHPDFAPLAQEVVVPDQPAATSVVLQLVEGCTLAGMVRDGDGNPVAGAGVRILSGLMDPLVWRTDEAGSFTATHLPPHVVLQVQAPGYLTADLERDLAGTPCAGDAEIGLVRLGGRIAGRVIDARRFPIGGARVRAEPAGGEVRWASQGTTTGADGTFRLAAPSSGEVRLVASHPDYVEASVDASVGATVEVVLDPGVVVSGSVTDEVGEPLTAAVALRRDGREIAAAVAGPDGKFRAGRVAAGDYELRATAAGFADQTLVIGLAAPGEVEGEVERVVEISMRRGVTLEGRVVDRFGSPVGGAAIELRLSGSRTAPRSARSDADGRFAAAGLDPGRWEIEASRDDLGRVAAVATLDVGTRSRPVELAFRDAADAGAGAEPGAGADPSSGRVGYSLVNDQVIVRTPATYAAPGTDLLLAGDTIFQVERERIRDLETLHGIVGSLHRETVSVAVLRDGRRKFLTVDRNALLADGWE